MSAMAGRSNSTSEERERGRHALLLCIVGGVATVVTLLFMLLSQFDGWIAATGVGGLITFLGMSIGGFLGFLFSVPRILAKDSTAPLSAIVGAAANGTGPSAPPAAVAAIKRERLLSSNTNLERISEWLTTMLVGVGLTQIGSLDRAIMGLSGFLDAKARVFLVDGQPNAGVLPAIGPLLLVCGLVSGFIFFYLYTRIYLSPLFQRAEEILGDELSTEPLLTAVPEFRNAAASLAEGTDNLSMAYTSKASEISIADSLDVIQNLLYKTDGYARALELGNKLVTTPAVKLARYWFLMSAAYGQKHHALLDADAPEAERLSARRAVLDAVQKTVQLNPSYRARLIALTDAGAFDNDLQDFATSDDFWRIVK